ncbi:unnamed protein product [Ambrosiozyma monospora]|uniref:Unnamed protein product n=1 Tax=Ambrosiozyma monospora TaxID=43982 RepID=A0A9W6YTZ0_AMBMO|nr:unnamed protein product [Ambrosiozyma monospora]
MTTKISFRSEPLLNQLSKTLDSNQSLRKEAIQSLSSKISFEVTTKKNGGSSQFWLLDAENDGNLKHIAEPPSSDDESIGIRIKITDPDLRKLIAGKTSAQRLFMTGKLKIKGNVMKAAYIEKLLKFASPVKSKL